MVPFVATLSVLSGLKVRVTAEMESPSLRLVDSTQFVPVLSDSPTFTFWSFALTVSARAVMFAYVLVWLLVSSI